MKAFRTKNYYLAGIIFCSLFTFVYSIPAWPLFIKCFLSFPKLEDTTFYEGTLHIEGETRSTKYGEIAPDYYIIDKQGVKHKIFWGFPGNHEERFLGKESAFNGSVGTVSFHPIFGVVEESFTTTFPGEKPDKWTHPYEKRKFYYGYQFNYKKYLWKLWPALTVFMFVLYNLDKYKSFNSPKQENDND